MASLEDFIMIYRRIDPLWRNYLSTNPGQLDEIPWGAKYNLITASRVVFRIVAAISNELEDWAVTISESDFTRNQLVSDSTFTWNPRDTDPAQSVGW